jgi:steroid delta-isomerase-like uncharacterized protein
MSPSVSSAPNGDLGHRFFEAQDRLRGGPDPALCAPGYTATIGGNPPMDLAGHQGFGRMFYAAFPDLSHTVEDTVADEGRVAVRFTLHGTHSGDFSGIPATGRPIAVSAMVVLRVADGRVAELRGVFDQLGLMQQLGVIPAPEPAAS